MKLPKQAAPIQRISPTAGGNQQAQQGVEPSNPALMALAPMIPGLLEQVPTLLKAFGW